MLSQKTLNKVYQIMKKPNILGEHKEKRKEYIIKLKEALLTKYFETEFESRVQNRTMVLEPNKKTYLNGQQISVATYVNVLKEDLNNLEQRIELVNDIEKELKKFGATKFMNLSYVEQLCLTDSIMNIKRLKKK